MTIRVAINGYGRIGRNILRALYESERTDEIRIVALNDLGDTATNAHLTRYDTAHGRFPGRASLPHRAGFLHRPIVEEYGALLRRWLRQAGVQVPEPPRRFSVLLTHDVDALPSWPRARRLARTVVNAARGRQPLRHVPQALAAAARLARDRFDTLEELIALDACLDGGPRCPRHESLYFFKAGGSRRLERRYDVRSRAARKAIRRVLASGAAVGLHASYAAGLEPARIADERATLEGVCGFPIRRNRHHYLGWREIEDGRRLARAGIRWDATLGYADVAGFRLGVCHPIPLFDPIAVQPLGIEEHPLIVMDGTLRSASYMGLSESAAFACCQRLIAATRRHRGEFVLLWHDTSLARTRGNYLPRLYRRLLGALAADAPPPVRRTASTGGALP